MYIIKMEQDKTLITTVHTNIYKGENGSDQITFIIPKEYNGIDIGTCKMYLRYILPNDIGYSEYIQKKEELYDERFYVYEREIDTRLTSIVGDIEIWLTALRADGSVVLKTSSTFMSILDSVDITEHMPDEEIDQLDKLSLQVEQLQKTKADNVVFNPDENSVQLTADGSLIGAALDIDEIEDSTGGVILFE